MPDKTLNNDSVLAQLRQEFIESARDELDDIDLKLDRIETGESTAEAELLGIQRRIHNIKGQGGTFGYPLTSRVAHMLEDYLENAGGILLNGVADVRAYITLMLELVSTGEAAAENNTRALLSALPTGQTVTFSTQQTHDINVLLVMPSGLQRKMVATELLSCGFRVMRAHDSLEALSVAVDLAPDIVFVNYDIGPFNGRELANIFGAVETLRDIHFVVLTSYQVGDSKLQDLPDTVSVVHKREDFTESIGELMIQWGVFGNIPDKPAEASKPISKHPKTANIVKVTTKRSLKILAAEDNPVNQQLIKATIEAFGHHLDIAENGLQAVEAIIGADFDLVLMDVRMPEMDGLDATRTIRKLPNAKSRIPIIAVTADAATDHKDQYLAAGMNECVGKPINRGELLTAINTVMGEEIHAAVTDDEAADDAPQVAEATDGDIEDFLKQLQDVSDDHDAQKKRRT